MKKRIVAIAVAAAMMVLLSACGGNDDNSSAGDMLATGESSSAEGNVVSGDDISSLNGASLIGADSEQQTESEEYRRPLDLQTVYDAILAEQPENMDALVLQPEENRDVIYSVYPTLENVDVNQMVYYCPPEAGYPCEIIMIEAQSQRGADYAYDVFLDRIERGAADTASPENAEGWINRAEVHQEGVYVAMIVLPEGYEIPYNVFSLVD